VSTDAPRREADAIIEVTKESAAIQVENLTPGHLVAFRGDQAVRIGDLERFAAAPHAPRGLYHVNTVESFIAYAKHHAGDAATTMWVDAATGVIVAVFDDHSAEQARWGEHRAQLVLEWSPAWLRWREHDRKMLSQEDFAEHVENSIPDIASPSASDLLEMAQTISMTTQATFRSAKRLHDGRTQLTYNEELQTSAGSSGEMEIPKELTLMLAPFVGEEAIPVIARLRTRLNRETLTIGYILERPDELVREAVEALTGRVRAEFARVYVGAPPDPGR